MCQRHNTMMAIPRHQLVDPDNPLFYHLVSRCVRRGWLCGFDRTTRTDYTHRKDWLKARLEVLGAAFAVDVYAYAIMSNHFHLVVYYDPQAQKRWTDLEVVERWLRVCPPKRPDGSIDEDMKAMRRKAWLADPLRLVQLRSKLGSLSLFMKLLKQPIARRANLEDGCTGHFFEQRFYSGALLSETAVLAAMAYVDLNPVRAKIARSIAEAEHTSIHHRLHHLDSAGLEAYLQPVVSGLGVGAPFSVTLHQYVDRLEVLIPSTPIRWRPVKLERWRDQVATLKRRQRAFGPKALIQSWVSKRGWQTRELPLPQ